MAAERSDEAGAEAAGADVAGADDADGVDDAPERAAMMVALVAFGPTSMPEALAIVTSSSLDLVMRFGREGPVGFSAM